MQSAAVLRPFQNDLTRAMGAYLRPLRKQHHRDDQMALFSQSGHTLGVAEKSSVTESLEALRTDQRRSFQNHEYTTGPPLRDFHR